MHEYDDLTDLCNEDLKLSQSSGVKRTVEDSQIDVMFHQPHAGIPRPALFVVVAHDVFVVWIGVLREITLNQVSGILC